MTRGWQADTKFSAAVEDGVDAPRAAAERLDRDDIENEAHEEAHEGLPIDRDAERYEDEVPTDAEFLELAREAETSSKDYSGQVDVNSWQRVYKAYHQEHFTGSKYEASNPDYRNRSKLFIPKTRAAIRKDLAAVAASLFGSLDAVNCMPGNESDPQQRASAAIIQELVNYRTDRASAKASIPWFHVALGARFTSLMTGICLSKQSWKLELRRDTEETFKDENGEDAVRDVYKPHIDRPDIELFPPENFTIDPAADWTNPAQDAAYVNLKWPMRLNEIRAKQRDPRNPWHDLPDNVLLGAGEEDDKQSAIRRSREQGLDRFSDSKSSKKTFEVIWVWETFVRTAGEDWCFLSIAGKHLLTDPRPVREVYPEQLGERPIVFGYGAFEPFRIFPMSSAESWQMLQQEANDLRNLRLDSIKQNVMPVAKVVRGKQVDLEQLRRRGQGTSIMVTNKDDVTWEKVPDVSGSLQAMQQDLNVEFDDLAGQQNYGTVQDSNTLGRTLGGLKLAAGAANAVQEFDIRVWIETYVEHVLTQIVRLEQFYESDPIVLGLCGDRAQLMQKFGVDEINDDLLENNVTIRVNIGLGAGDPAQRLQKFQSASAIVAPLLAQSPEFMSGKKQMDYEAIMQEVFGAAGYRDGGKRFIKDGDPKGPNPGQDAALDKIKSETDKNKALAKKAIMDALSNAAKVGLDVRALELAVADQQFRQHLDHVNQVGTATDMGHRHAGAIASARQAALAPPNPIATAAAPPSGPSVSPIVPGPDAPGAGNGGLSPEDVGNHGVPAGDAAQQHEADAAELQKNLDRSVAEQPKGRNRTIKITKRGADGRASEFAVEEA